jgi:citrate lyase subunit beta / citryl-CoA lyase
MAGAKRNGADFIRRSLLATPGNVAAKLEKARSLHVDVLMLDLEDGVPGTDGAKQRARELLGAAIGSGPFATREIAIRINGPRSPWFLDDIAFIAGLDIPSIVVPMVEDADDMIFVERALDQAGVPDSFNLILLIETPAAVLNLPQMVEASPRTNGLIAGGLDYAMCTHSLSILPLESVAPAGRHDEDLLYMRQRVLAVARAYGLSALDALRPGLLSDLEVVRKDVEYARWLGFDGVDFYHPAFIDMANEVFTPSADELAWADRVLDGVNAQDSDAPASRTVDGRVVLPQHIEIAGRLKALAQAVSA